jgi:hypothetical protein
MVIAVSAFAGLKTPPSAAADSAVKTAVAMELRLLFTVDLMTTISTIAVRQPAAGDCRRETANYVATSPGTDAGNVKRRSGWRT